MFKNIVSSLFDTINDEHMREQHMQEQHMHEQEQVQTEQHEEQLEPIAQVPNHLLPIKFTTVKPVVICVYQISTIGQQPFLLFLLKKHDQGLSFIPCPNHKKIKYSKIRDFFP